MDKILSFLSPIKYYLLVIALLAYPAVWSWGDLHGKSVARLQDVQNVVKEDQSIAAENKKAAEAALNGEAKLNSDLNAIDKTPALPPSNDPCKPSPERVQSLQDLIDQANKP